ncbi:WD repeat-containing protein 55 [Durusdinium trenchii]|uniref:WD repeat-containing protein 55 n=1 Tax=Durusdinium trenchii TaxID=1381693 RepID=A0ABP0PAP7_9DINO
MKRELRCSAQVVGLALHPAAPVCAAGLVDGALELWRFGWTTGEREDGAGKAIDHGSSSSSKGSSSSSSSSFACSSAPGGEGGSPGGKVTVKVPAAHTDSTRVVAFCGRDGARLVTGSADRAVKCWDAGTAALSWEVIGAHENAVNCLLPLESVADGAMLVSGDEEGEIKLWDVRVGGKPLATVKQHDDYISDMAFDEKRKTLLSTSGDGMLSAFDLRATSKAKLKHKATSDKHDEDLLSLVVIKNGSKVVVGTQNGVLDFWNWGEWGDIADRFPGHPESIDSILKIDESTICTGSSDGILRIINVYPHKLLGVMGDHTDFPIERLAWSHDRTMIASASHDAVIRFWDTSAAAKRMKKSRDADDDDFYADM